MDVTTVAAAGLYVVAVGGAAYQWRGSDWDPRRTLGTAAFLLGVGVGLFGDDLLAAALADPPAALAWVELVGAGIAVVGLVLQWQSGPGRERTGGTAPSR